MMMVLDSFSSFSITFIDYLIPGSPYSYYFDDFLFVFGIIVVLAGRLLKWQLLIYCLWSAESVLY